MRRRDGRFRQNSGSVTALADSDRRHIPSEVPSQWARFVLGRRYRDPTDSLLRHDLESRDHVPGEGADDDSLVAGEDEMTRTLDPAEVGYLVP